MREIDTILRAVDEVPAPDLWEEIVVRALAPEPIRSRPRIRLVPRLSIVGAALVAIVVAIVTLVPRPPTAFAIIKGAIEDFTHIPPFRATIVGPTPNEGPRPPSSFETLEVSYRDANAWRVRVVHIFPELERPTPFQLWDGERFYSYDARSNTYVVGTLAEGFSPLGFLSWDRGGVRFWRDRCGDDASEVIGVETVAGRAAQHIRCGVLELWVDVETGLMLKIRSNQSPSAQPEPFPGPIGLLPGTSVEITNVQFNPNFDPDTFRFTPPRDPNTGYLARQVDQFPGEEEPPPAGTIRPGSIAPAWRGPLLSGDELSSDQLRGKPTAVYFWGTWCTPCVGGRLDALQSAFEKYGDRMHVVSVAVQDSRSSLEETVRRGGYDFPIVIDNPARSPFGAIGGAWSIQSVPSLVLLDPEGRVEAVYIPQRGMTAEQLKGYLDAFAQGHPLPSDGP